MSHRALSEPAGAWFCDGTDGERGFSYRADDHVFKVPEVSDILEGSGLFGSFDGIDPFYAERGSAVHKAIALDMADNLDESSLDPTIEVFFRAYRAFCEDTGTVPQDDGILFEQPLLAPDLAFGGVVDFVQTITPERYRVIDWKTGSIDSDRYRAQMGAYLELLRHRFRHEPDAEFDLWLVQLRADGRYRVREVGGLVSTSLWLQAKAAYHSNRRSA